MTNICRIVYGKFKNDIEKAIHLTEKAEKRGVEQAFGICRYPNGELVKTKSSSEWREGMTLLPTDCPEGSKLVGSFHSHHSDMHSDTDILADLINGLEFSCIGYIRKFNPQKGEYDKKYGLKCIDYSKVSEEGIDYILDELREFREWYNEVERPTPLEVYKHLKTIMDTIKRHGGEICEIPIEVEIQ